MYASVLSKSSTGLCGKQLSTVWTAGSAGSGPGQGPGAPATGQEEKPQQDLECPGRLGRQL